MKARTWSARAVLAPAATMAAPVPPRAFDGVRAWGLATLFFAAIQLGLFVGALLHG